jgi:hypothetical protein
MTYKNPLIHIVHCIDTEGPLDEDLNATFGRIKSIFGIDLPPSKNMLLKLQNKEVDLKGLEDAVSKCVDKKLLEYNRNWADISNMLDYIMSNEFRNLMLDDFNNGWVYSWHCMDHMGLSENPRHKDFGYGNIFRFYKSKLIETKSNNDELNWHFHPLSLTRNPLSSATSYYNSMDILINILCRRIIEDEWFPVVNRPGFHSERPDSHLFLEQWIPYDYANQFIEAEEFQPDMLNGRFGDWKRAPKTWRGYNPSHIDYQLEGSCRRKIFRCLNIGTRLRELNDGHLQEAYFDAKEYGQAIVAFADHDYRNISNDVKKMRELVSSLKKTYPDVRIKFSGAEEAAKSLDQSNVDIDFELKIIDNKLIVEMIKGETFGPQPFLALKTKDGKYYHDNFDFIEPMKIWSYVFDSQTIDLSSLSIIGVGSAGRHGNFSVKTLIL